MQSVSGATTSAMHTFAAGGSYTISASATDDVGTYTANNQVVTANPANVTLAISGNSSVAEGSEYDLSLSSIDPNQPIVSWTINWGDGQIQSVSENPESVPHTYEVGPNSYTISATATDNIGIYSSNTQSVTVSHVPPTLAIAGPGSIAEQSSYILSLSATDPGHTISSWAITWGDGHIQTVNGNPSSVSHTYALGPNSYTISATATDDVGTYSANTQAITVNHVPPTLMIAGPGSIAEQSSYSLSLSATDPGHTISSWAITWGDGNTQTVNGNPASVQHTYALGPNSYTISATATDDVGTYSANTQAITVNHVPPTLMIAGPGSIAEQASYILSLSTIDPGHTISSWAITWGDGHIQTVNGNPSSVSHTYALGPNSYTISATATDDVSTYTANTRPVTVTHVPPILAISGPGSVNEGSSFVLALSAIDPGHIVSSWTINWGDGSIQSVSGNSASVSHTYAVGPNSYTIRAAAIDDVGTYDSNSPTVNVAQVPPVIAISGPSTLYEYSSYALTLGNVTDVTGAPCRRSS